MKRVRVTILLIVALVSTAVAQDNPVRLHTDSKLTSHGFNYTQGGVGMSMQLYGRPPGEELLRGHLNLLTPTCGLDFDAAFIARLEELPEQMLMLMQAYALGWGITYLCQLAPSACDLYKSLHSILNFSLRTSQLDCNQLVSQSMLRGVAARQDAVGDCVRRQLASGNPNFSAIWNDCMQSPKWLRAIDGSQRTQINLIKDLLLHVDLGPQRSARVRRVFGDIVMTIHNGTITTQSNVSSGTAARIYEEEKEKIRVDIVRPAINDARNNRDLRSISVDGVMVPNDVIENIALEPTTEMRAAKADRLASALALHQAVSVLTSAREDLLEAMLTVDISREKREVILLHIDLNREQVRILHERFAAADKYLGPLLNAEMAEYRWRLNEAGRNWADTHKSGIGLERYKSGDHPLGYRQ